MLNMVLVVFLTKLYLDKELIVTPQESESQVGWKHFVSEKMCGSCFCFLQNLFVEDTKKLLHVLVLEYFKANI